MSSPAQAPAADPRQEPIARWLWRAAVVSVLLSVPRAILVLARFGQFQPGLDDLAGIGALGFLGEGLLLTLPIAFALVSMAELSLRGGTKWVARVLIGATVLAGFCFVTFRWPSSELFAPGWESDRARVVQLAALVVALVAGWITWPRSRVPALAPLGGLALLVAVLCPLFALASRKATPRWPDRPNVILISLDTLRSDRLQSYGYERATSPHIASFFESAYRFEQVLAPDAWTLSCHVSMLTGLEPSAHGVGEETALAPPVPTLASHMLDAGYTTMAIVDDCPWVGPRYGLGRGFEIYRTVADGAQSKVAQSIELMEVADGRPFLMFLHCYDAHSDFGELPYESDLDHMQQFAGSYEGNFTGLSPDGSQGASAYMQELNDRGERPGPEERAWISDLYDAGIATLDRELLTLFEYLESSGRLEDSVVILTSDHGEEFYEHGKSLHSQFYREHLQVPLMIRTPESGPRQVEALVGLVDITPTILDLCGLEYQLQSEEPSSGHSLVPLMRAADRATREERSYIVAEAKDSLVGIRSTEGSLVRFGGHWKLFDRQRDPDELDDKIQDPAYQDLELELRTYLEESGARLRKRVEARSKQRTKVGVSDAERERLRSLGYVGEE